MTNEQCCEIVYGATRAITNQGTTVTFGPFKGMQMGYCFHPYYLLGTYELELHGIIRKISTLNLGLIVNVGAADGYYAIGLALQHPESRVDAFELREKAQLNIKILAELNDVSERVTIHGACLPENLGVAVGDGIKCLVVMDCEGGEKELLDPAIIPAIRNCTILVELHEFAHLGIVEEIRSRFSSSHKIEQVFCRFASMDDLPFTPPPETMTEELQHYWVSSIDENRPKDMSWFYMEPRAK